MGDTGTLETAVSVLSREGGWRVGHTGAGSHAHDTGGICVFISPSLLYSLLSLPVTEGQVVGGTTPGVRGVNISSFYRVL